MDPIPKRLLPVLLFLAASSLILPTHQVGAQVSNPAPIQLLATAYADLDGDHDAYPDTGETGRLTLTVKNTGTQVLTGIVFNLVSTDSDVACITEHAVSKASLAPGEVATIGSLTAGPAGFTFRASDSLNSASTTDIALVDMCLIVTADGISGLADPICFRLPADIDLPTGASQTYTLGPDGIAGTADDGTVLENFDIDKNGDGVFTIDDTFRTPSGPGTYTGYCSTAPQTACATSATCPSGGICYTGSYIRGDATGMAPGLVSRVVCSGFDSPAVNPGCALDPDYPMDWHFHCPNGATNCPNVESGTCVGGCSYDTPMDGNKAHTGPNSLHMGAHFDPTFSANGDTTHLRTLQGFQSAPMNLALFPALGDLEMSFYHIARLMDNNGVGPANNHQCSDCGDVQVRLDQDADPAVDNWGFWDKLAPFENVYDHTPLAYSTFGPYYCLSTPADTGNAAPAPNGAHETICHGMGAWSHCGSTSGTTASSVGDCNGPGELDPSGLGVWVKSKFNLSGYLGQRIEIRWIAATWLFDTNSSSYYEVGGGWSNTLQDDGWWLDDIRVTGTITGQLTPLLDSSAAPPTTCSVQPDLAEGAVVDPSTPVHAGDSIDLADTAVNVGDDAVADSVTGYYLSLDTTKDGSDTSLGTRSTGALAAGGGTSTGSATVTVPMSMPVGHYYLIACADNPGSIAESAENNNCRASANTVAVQPLGGIPDLIESALTDPPASIVAGNILIVSETATNQGTADAGSSVTRFFLSADVVRDGGDQAIGDRILSPLAAGASSSGPLAAFISETTPGGLYFLIVCADATGTVTESDETNNCRTSTTRMLVTKADLVETAVNNPPMKIAAGAAFIASDTVTNQGNGASVASGTRYFLGVAATRSIFDVVLGTRNVGAIAPTASSAGNAFVTVPAATTPASYYLIACADDNHVVPESNETNNCRASVKQVAVTGPDLTETAVPNPPATVNVGAVITVSDTAKNIGNGDAPGSVTRYYLSNDGLKSAGDLPLGSRVVGPLQVNKSSSGSASVTIPGTAGGATWFLLACADDDSTVPEASETNNCRAANKSVHVN